jgi:phosphoribosyl 1,2-cyclic phosphodiesterase
LPHQPKAFSMAKEPNENRGSADHLSVCVLASGSKGNSVYVSDGESAVLVDAGLSGKAIEGRMRERGLDPAALTAILVSHEHTDHVQGVGVLSRRYRLPVYLAPGTLGAVPKVGRLHETHPFECGCDFSIGGLRIHPFSISHDAADPAGFTFQCNGTKIGIATDLGLATAMVRERLKACTLLVLEANHDPDMLMDGPYPWPLKQRIKGRSGHLSNQESKDLLGEIQHENLAHVVLAHLSETNNTPDAAYRTVASALTKCAPTLSVAHQDRCGELIRLA